jgi:AP-3 complex subunit mu
MLDEGHPMTMETSMLKEIVLPPTLMRKLLGAAGVSRWVARVGRPPLRLTVQPPSLRLGAIHRAHTLAQAECAAREQ